jgi:hypothetical protein
MAEAKIAKAMEHIHTPDSWGRAIDQSEYAEPGRIHYRLLG